MATKSSAKKLIFYDKLLVKDLDELVEEKEVIEAISPLTGSDHTNFMITANFKVDRGMKGMVVAMKPKSIEKILKVGKVRIGFVVCRVKRREKHYTG